MNCVTYSSSDSFFRPISQYSKFTPVFFKAACHYDPGAERNFTESDKFSLTIF